MITSAVTYSGLPRGVSERQVAARSANPSSSVKTSNPKSDSTIPTVQNLMPGEPTSYKPGLVSSIMSDGGLSFLRSHVEKKLSGLFDEASKQNPDVTAVNPDAFFDPDLDMSSEATASRIIGFALGLKDAYRHQHPGLSEKELSQSFEKEVRRGIADGFSHARQVLGGLGALAGDIQQNVDETWTIVQQSLEDFFSPKEED